MTKDYLAMIADIDTEKSHESYEINELHEINRNPLVTPASILASSRYSSLTRGGLRDALMLAAHRRGVSCTAEDALLCIAVSLGAGIIVGPDDDGLYRVAH